MSQRFDSSQGGRNAKLTGRFDGDLFDGQRLLPLAFVELRICLSREREREDGSIVLFRCLMCSRIESCGIVWNFKYTGV